MTAKRLRAALLTEHHSGAFLGKYALFAAWAATILIFALLNPGTFLARQNITSTLSSQTVLVVLTYALVVTLTAGEYDVSVAAVLTLSSMIIAILNTEDHINIVLSVLVALVAGLMVGIINSVVIVTIGVDSIIATLGMGSVLSGVVLWISGGNTLSGISHSLVTLVVVPHVFGLSLSFLYVVAATVMLWYVLSYLPVGRRLLYVGRSREVSRLAGLGVGRIRSGALIAGSFTAAAAGVLYAGTTGSADPSSGLTFLLPAFAGAFLGATTIQPGRFNAWGAFAAVYFLVTGIDGLSLLGIQVFVQDLFYGAALIVAVSISMLARRRARVSLGHCIFLRFRPNKIAVLQSTGASRGVAPGLGRGMAQVPSDHQKRDPGGTGIDSKCQVSPHHRSREITSEYQQHARRDQSWPTPFPGHCGRRRRCTRRGPTRHDESRQGADHKGQAGQPDRSSAGDGLILRPGEAD